MRALVVLLVWILGALKVLLFAHGLNATEMIHNSVCSICTNGDSNYELYTRTNPDTSFILKEGDDASVKLEQKENNILIVHGYMHTATDLFLIEMKNAYLLRYDANVIMLNWTRAASVLYPIVVHCNIPLISKKVAQFLCSLNIPLDKWHLVGHSLGAHMSGFIGENTMKICGQKIDRITGLDPAGPLFTLDIAGGRRLNQTDANFVDVIHTNEGLMGYYGNCGHVDFHVNCGTFQNGCEDVKSSDIGNTIYNRLLCDHQRSVEYMIESINSTNFIAQSCSKYSMICVGDHKPEYIIMGEDCPRNSTQKVFHLSTRNKSPYALKCSTFPKGCS